MNIIDIYEKFPNQEKCIKYLEQSRWNGKTVCPYCKSAHVKSYEALRHFCLGCRKSFSVTVGTIFHKTQMPLQKWFLAISLILNAKKGLSGLQMSRDLKINKNTAWRIAMQIRRAFSNANQKNILSGVLEMDETFVGANRNGKAKKNNEILKRGRGTRKVPVVGVIERKGSIRATVAKKLNGESLKKIIDRFADISKSGVITDEYRGYSRFYEILPHAMVTHEKATGKIHTNNIEGFWALLKRGIMGQYHSITKEHLQEYIEEFCYRFNNRNNANVFEDTLALVMA